MKKILIILIFLELLFFTQSSPSNIKTRSLDEDSTKNTVDYLNLFITIFESIENECFVDINNTLNERMKYEIDKKFPWLADSLGKGINDIGDEKECLRTLENTTFFIVNFYNLNLTLFLEKDQELIDFLDIHNYTFGICLMYSCKPAFNRYFKIIAEFVNYVTSNIITTSDDLVQIFEHNKIESKEVNEENLSNEENLQTKTTKLILIGIFLFLIILKILISVIRIFLIPKGYDIYATERMNKLSGSENNDIEEQLNLSSKSKINEPLNDESNTKEYNPLFDFSDKLPKGFRILRVFDIINDIYYLTSKRNRYFNDNDLEVIAFNRAIVVFSLVFSHTFSALVTLPSEEIINSSFFRDGLNILYRLSNNALICWVFLEGAYTTYKLLCFIQKEMFIYYSKGFKKGIKLSIKLLIIFLKFLVLLIPKIIIFTLIYFLLYYKIEDYRFIFESKATFHHIITNIFKNGIQCDSQNNTIFPYFNFTQSNVFNYSIDNYKACYEFIYFYLNMFFSILLFMIIMYTFFVFRSKIYELVIIILNLIWFFVSIIPVKDDKTDPIEDEKGNKIYKKLKYYHIKGQTYSTKIFQSFIGFYQLGFIIGFLMFNMTDLDQRIQRLVYEYNKTVIKKIDNKKEEENKSDNSLIQPLDEKDEAEISFTNRSKSLSSSKKEEDKDKSSLGYYKLPYYPLQFLNEYLNSIKKLNIGIKIIIVFGGIILLGGIDYILLTYIIYHDTFKKDLDDFPLFLFRYEKHFFMIVYFFIIVILITLPKNSALRNFMGSKIFILISRLGFIFTCISYSLTYLAFLLFSLKVKLYVPAFMIISFGNFLLFFGICILIFACFEVPLRILIKKLLRINTDKSSIII